MFYRSRLSSNVVVLYCCSEVRGLVFYYTVFTVRKKKSNVMACACILKLLSRRQEVVSSRLAWPDLCEKRMYVFQRIESGNILVGIKYTVGNHGKFPVD